MKWKALSKDDETLGTWLQASGYETAAAISNLHLTRRRNFDRGFDHYENLRVEADGLLGTDGEAATEGVEDDDNGGGESTLAWEHPVPYPFADASLAGVNKPVHARVGGVSVLAALGLGDGTRGAGNRPIH